MSDPIRVGDLVVVARWPHVCPLGPRSLGKVFVVDNFHSETWCPECNTVMPGVAAGTGEVLCFPLTWLKKIPPLADLEGKLDLADIRGPQPTKEHA